jgi:hypothetical protein
MASLIPSGSASGTGSVTLTVPTTNNNQTATLPDATGTVMVSGNMPAFRAYATSGQTIANLTFTKIQFNNKSFDTNNNFDSTTNYRFTPTVSGYYQVNGVFALNGSALGYATLAIYKNGTIINQGASTPNNTTFGGGSNVSDVIYMNGSTDYLELFCAQSSGGSLTVQVGVNTNIFSACLIRAA